MMLPRADAQRLVDRYFDFAMPTYRFLHRPTIQAWFDEFYDTLGVMRDPVRAPARIALLFMVFAQGRVYMPDDDVPGPADLRWAAFFLMSSSLDKQQVDTHASTRYFLAAEHQLAKERGLTRLTSVQARLTQCYYLLTQSRINHCWSLFGTVSHLVLAIGLNRNKRPATSSSSSSSSPATTMAGLIETESRRRTFWCAYTLDAFLSVALGRPRSLHDDDIDVELPACLDDDELDPACASQCGTRAPRPGPPIMLAPLAHIK
ncbi:hypothetical protein VTK73DRAFT_942 [Phialemonium thermophilum]|uniref:Xylanolytic transcriptional activator regulatory domain-containing protein n=1 Tax=Phialemonium thermophilum TaxID=223376 RepID=A0ABR3VU35_9PEZI